MTSLSAIGLGVSTKSDTACQLKSGLSQPDGAPRDQSEVTTQFAICIVAHFFAHVGKFLTYATIVSN